jgi:5-aminolevulinate synthase
MLPIKLFQDVIDRLKASGNYRVFNNVLRKAGSYPDTLWYNPINIKTVTNWCSNDYLGMGQHKDVIDAMKTALDTTGAGSGGTRNISGTSNYHVALELELARLHQKQSALVHSSAFVANEWTLIALSKIIPNLEFVSDSENHASIVQGIVNSGAPKHIFRHNDLEDLENKLKTVSGTPCIVFETVYSMDGDVGLISDICDLADKYNAITYCDEVHAIGLYGHNGAGWLEQIGMMNRIDVISAGLGKAYGVQGGYIVGDGVALDAIRHVSAGFIFTTSLSPAMCAGAWAAVKLLKSDEGRELRRRHQENAGLLKELLKVANIEVFENQSHLVPVMIRDAVKCKQVSDILLRKHEIYVQPINYPTVPMGTERLRFAPTPMHTEAMIYNLVEKLKLTLEEIDD